MSLKIFPFPPKKNTPLEVISERELTNPKFIFSDVVGHSFCSLLHNRPLHSLVVSNHHHFIMLVIFWLRNLGIVQQK